MSAALNWWTRRGAWLMAVVFAAAVFTLLTLRYAAFQMPGLDLAENDQAIWNTLHGRFLYSTIHHFPILAQHFSPLMALFSPLFLIWSDIRVLFLAQAIGLAVSGLFLYQIVHIKRPKLAPWFLLAYYLNPALHEVALVDLRRVTVAVPFLAMALYGLFAKKRVLMVVGLTIALLCKEDIGLVVMAVGLYLVIFEREWKWGVPTALLGGAWSVVVTLWVIPTFFPQSDVPGIYPQFNYLGLPGSSYREAVAYLLHDPLLLLRRLVDREALRALWRVFFPVAFLPLLAPDWFLVGLVPMLYMLMMTSSPMHRLEDWYMASVLPGFFAAIAVALTRVAERWMRWVVPALLGTTLIGYLLYSYAPLGGQYDPHQYQVTARHRLADRVLASVPSDARVAAQDPYVAHLSHREYIYLYPWIRGGHQGVDYFVLDRHTNPYPLSPDQLNEAIDNMVADPAYVVEQEGDGIFLIHRGGSSLPSTPVGAVVGGTMALVRVEVAVLDGDGLYRTVDQPMVEVEAGQQVRVSLYWEALEAVGAERTVSVRIAASSGALVAQYDTMPGQGKKPTSWWEKGWRIRDVYYLTVSPDAPVGLAGLNVLVYDSFALSTVSWEDGRGQATVCPVVIRAK
jgi:uncharacterized membrane protein